MTFAAAKPILIRALAFASTLIFSFVFVNGLPRVKQERQRYFAQATIDGNLSRMRLLRLAGANVNSRSAGSMPLSLAAAEGKINAVRYLISEGADVNARGTLGDTALTEAAFYGQIATAKELLLHGADVNAISDEGTALDIAINKRNETLAELIKHYGGKRGCEIHRWADSFDQRS